MARSGGMHCMQVARSRQSAVRVPPPPEATGMLRPAAVLTTMSDEALSGVAIEEEMEEKEIVALEESMCVRHPHGHAIWGARVGGIPYVCRCLLHALLPGIQTCLHADCRWDAAILLGIGQGVACTVWGLLILLLNVLVQVQRQYRHAGKQSKQSNCCCRTLVCAA